MSCKFLVLESSESDASDYRTPTKKGKMVPTIENLALLEDNKNQVFYDAYLGHGYSFRISTWEKNHGPYISIRRFIKTNFWEGANLPFACLMGLKAAVDHAVKIRKQFDA